MSDGGTEHIVHYHASDLERGIDYLEPTGLSFYRPSNGRNIEEGSSNELFNTLVQNLAIPPGYTTVRCNTLRCTPANALQQIQQRLGKEDSKFTVDIHQAIGDLVEIRNAGPFLREQVSKQVIVDNYCGMAVLRGAHIFAQGVLAASADMERNDKVSVYVDINGVCLKGSKPPFDFSKSFVGNGVAQFSRQELFAPDGSSLCGIGIAMTERLYESPPLNSLLPEIVFAQNLPSAVCVHVLDPQPGECILDMCAAPGGKTTHIASLMKNEGVLVALDKARNKLNALTTNLNRWGVRIAQVYCFDACSALAANAGHPSEKIGPPYPPGCFDRVLLDTPCSALGQRPSFCNRMTAKELASYPPLQRQLLATAIGLLRHGGTLVYSTCTFTSAENELQVEWVLQQYPDMVLVDQTPHLAPQIHHSSSSLPFSELRKLQRFHPAYIPDHPDSQSDTIGFFIAKFTKTVL